MDTTRNVHTAHTDTRRSRSRCAPLVIILKQRRRNTALKQRRRFAAQRSSSDWTAERRSAKLLCQRKCRIRCGNILSHRQSRRQGLGGACNFTCMFDTNSGLAMVVVRSVPEDQHVGSPALMSGSKLMSSKQFYLHVRHQLPCNILQTQLGSQSAIKRTLLNNHVRLCISFFRAKPLEDIEKMLCCVKYCTVTVCTAQY